MLRPGRCFSTKNNTQYGANFLYDLTTFAILDWHKRPLQKSSALELLFFLMTFSFDKHQYEKNGSILNVILPHSKENTLTFPMCSWYTSEVNKKSWNFVIAKCKIVTCLKKFREQIGSCHKNCYCSISICLTYNRVALPAMQRNGLKILHSSYSTLGFLDNFRGEIFHFSFKIFNDYEVTDIF